MVSKRVKQRWTLLTVAEFAAALAATPSIERYMLVMKLCKLENEAKTRSMPGY